MNNTAGVIKAVEDVHGPMTKDERDAINHHWNVQLAIDVDVIPDAVDPQQAIEKNFLQELFTDLAIYRHNLDLIDHDAHDDKRHPSSAYLWWSEAMLNSHQLLLVEWQGFALQQLTGIDSFYAG